MRTLLTDKTAYDAAIGICAAQGLIEPHVDEFGPDVYEFGPDFKNSFKGLVLSEANIRLFRKYKTGGKDWLKEALEVIEAETLADDEAASDEPDDWQPLPLERGNERLEALTKSLDETIEAVRTDNGYSACPKSS